MAILTVCAGAGYRWLELYGPITGLALVSAAAAIALVAAGRLRLEPVALASTAALLVVPTWASIVADAPLGLVGAWLAGFAVGAATVGARRRWIAYELVSTWAVALWVLGLAGALAAAGDTGHGPGGSSLVAVVGAVLWLRATFGDRRPAPDGEPATGLLAPARWRVARTWAAALLPLWTWSAVLAFTGLDPREGGGLVGLALAGGFLLLAALADPGGGADRLAGADVRSAHLLGAGALAAVVLVSWLDGPVLGPVLALQALLTAIVARRVGSRVLWIEAGAVAGLAALLLAVDLEAGLAAERLLPGRIVADAATIAALTALGHLLVRDRLPGLADWFHGLVALAAGLWVVTVGTPLLEGPAWFPLAVALSLLLLAAAGRFGPVVLVEGLLLGGVTVLVGGVGMLAVAVEGGTVGDHLAHLSVVVGLVAVAAGTLRRGPAAVAPPVTVAAWVLALGWVASAFLAVPQGHVVISGVWAVAAGAGLFVGVRRGLVWVRTMGLVTLTAVLVKLLTVDLATVETLWRVALFLAVGLGLLRLGYAIPDLARRSAPARRRPDGTPAAEADPPIPPEDPSMG